MGSKSLILTALLLATTTLASDCADLYYQCGGSYWSGATCCVTGSCSSQNDYYYQCVSTGDSNDSEAAAVIASTTSANTATEVDASIAATTSAVIAASDASEADTTSAVIAATEADTTSVVAAAGDSNTYVSYDADTASAVGGSVDYSYGSASTANDAVATTSETSAVAAAVQVSESSSSSASSASSSSSSSSSDIQIEKISGGQSGTAATTMYWDCCKPSCGWGTQSGVSGAVDTCSADGVTVLSSSSTETACSGGTAYVCTDQSPIVVNDTFAMGFIASYIDGTYECCKCYYLSFTDSLLTNKHMIVQATNTGSYTDDPHFDIAVPGGGVGDYNACSSQWGAGSDGWGKRYGGVQNETACSELPTELQTGCDFRWDWWGGADNPDAEFYEVTCPSELTTITGCSRTD